MAEWKQTFCILCYVNCGLEAATEGGKITRVRGDRANARSQGYLCQKPQRLQWYGDHADRLTTPLRRRLVDAGIRRDLLLDTLTASPRRTPVVATSTK